MKMGIVNSSTRYNLIIYVVTIVYISISLPGHCFEYIHDDNSNGVEIVIPRSIVNNICPAINLLLRDKIEFLTWPEANQRKVYRSRKTNIAMTFDTVGIIEGSYFANFFSYNFKSFHDYFCIPDDYIISYGENDNAFVTKALMLNWKLDYSLSNDLKHAEINYTFYPQFGFSKFALEGSREHGDVSTAGWSVPPAIITVKHEMFYDKNFVPMTVSITNIYNKPLHFIYVVQDGAVMTEDAIKKDGFVRYTQYDVHQYWDDGDYATARVWYINRHNRMNKNNWVGMYCDLNGGMFAATYAPPESKGIRLHATWDSANKALTTDDSDDVTGYIGHYYTSEGIQYPSGDWYRLENILYSVDTPSITNQYDNPTGKIHGTVVDFGTLDPGESRFQVVVKIMFSGYENRVDMQRKIKQIISQIPKFDIPEYSLEE